MATLILKVTSDASSATLQQNFERSTSSKYAVTESLVNLFSGLGSGCVKGSPPTVASSIRELATRASATFTLTSVVATNACSINGVSFAAVASSPTGNQFLVGATDNETADNLVAAINGSVTALVAGYVTAVKTSTADSPAVVRVYSTDYGIYGNQTTMASASGNIVASGTRLSGGAVDATAKSYTF